MGLLLRPSISIVARYETAWLRSDEREHHMSYSGRECVRCRLQNIAENLSEQVQELQRVVNRLVDHSNCC